MRKSSYPFVISLALHLTALSFLSLNTNNGGGGGSKPLGNGSQANSDGNILPKITEIDIITESDLGVGDKRKKKPKQKKHLDGLTECVGTDWYGGIGINQYYSTREIWAVADGYPAQKAGLRVGDIIESIASDTGANEIRGEPGTFVTLTIRRLDEILIIRIKRDRICIDGKKQP